LKSWKVEKLRSRKVGWLAGILVAAVAGIIYAGAPAELDADRFLGLKPGKGRELVLAHCIACHSPAIIHTNHMSRKEWDKTITAMQITNGMWPLPDSVRRQILDYLEQSQRPPDAGLRLGKSSPWAAPLYRPNPFWK